MSTLVANSEQSEAASIAEFCKRHGISQAMFFKLAKHGLGPKTMHIGRRVLVSSEAAEAWRRERETA